MQACKNPHKLRVKKKKRIAKTGLAFEMKNWRPSVTCQTLSGVQRSTAFRAELRSYITEQRFVLMSNTRPQVGHVNLTLVTLVTGDRTFGWTANHSTNRNECLNAPSWRLSVFTHDSSSSTGAKRPKSRRVGRPLAATCLTPGSGSAR